jgi:hypothetical protein
LIEIIAVPIREAGDVKTYRLSLVGASDGILYGIKEYEAESDARAAELAEQLCGRHPDDLWWQGQKLTTRLHPLDRRAAG